MKAALKLLLQRGIIGDDLLDAETQALRREVESLQKKHEDVKNQLQTEINATTQNKKDVAYIREMLQTLQVKLKN